MVTLGVFRSSLSCLFNIHFVFASCGSMLIQQGADLLNPVVQVTAKNEEKRPVWKWKHLHMAETIEPVTKVPLFQVGHLLEINDVCA